MHRIYIRTISIKVCKVVSVLLRLMADWFYLRRREVEFIADNKKPAEAGFSFSNDSDQSSRLMMPKICNKLMNRL